MRVAFALAVKAERGARSSWLSPKPEIHLIVRMCRALPDGRTELALSAVYQSEKPNYAKRTSGKSSQ